MKSCKKCCFYEQCGQRRTCEFYAPTDDTEAARDERVWKWLDRKEFREEWHEYMKRDDEEFDYADLGN